MISLSLLRSTIWKRGTILIPKDYGISIKKFQNSKGNESSITCNDPLPGPPQPKNVFSKRYLALIKVLELLREFSE